MKNDNKYKIINFELSSNLSLIKTQLIICNLGQKYIDLKKRFDLYCKYCTHCQKSIKDRPCSDCLRKSHFKPNDHWLKKHNDINLK